MKSKEETHLESKIRMFEDMLLRCRNFSRIGIIQSELTKMRIRLQKLYFNRMESLLGLFLFARIPPRLFLRLLIFNLE